MFSKRLKRNDIPSREAKPNKHSVTCTIQTQYRLKTHRQFSPLYLDVRSLDHANVSPLLKSVSEEKQLPFRFYWTKVPLCHKLYNVYADLRQERCWFKSQNTIHSHLNKLNAKKIIDRLLTVLR